MDFFFHACGWPFGRRWMTICTPCGRLFSRLLVTLYKLMDDYLHALWMTSCTLVDDFLHGFRWLFARLADDFFARLPMTICTPCGWLFARFSMTVCTPCGWLLWWCTHLCGGVPIKEVRWFTHGVFSGYDSEWRRGLGRKDGWASPLLILHTVLFYGSVQSCKKISVCTSETLQATLTRRAFTSILRPCRHWADGFSTVLSV